MNSNLQNFCNRLDKGVDTTRKLTSTFRDMLNLTAFAYVRVYHDGRVGWVSSDADHDRLLIESGSLTEDPLVDTAELLKEGRYLWFHDRKFPGSESFYRDRSRIFGLDHGLVIVNHHKDYLETGAFSGSLAKRPLYNLFMNETGLFRAFMDYFKKHLNKTLTSLLEEGLMIDDLKPAEKRSPSKPSDISPNIRSLLVTTYGSSDLLTLSTRERDCLALMRHSFTYQEMGDLLKVSPRTVEHYLESIKNKLNIQTRAELRAAAQKLTEFGLADKP